MGQDDKTYVQKAQSGSRKAFDKLVKKYADLIFYLLYDITGNYDDAQDLTQESFLRAFTHIQKYRGEAKFTTWLYRIAYNVAIDHKRREKKIKPVEWDTIEHKVVLGKIGKTDKIHYKEEKLLIEKALNKLTHSQKIAVVLHYYHGFKMREIGEIIDCSEGTARVHLFRALQKMRNHLKDFDPRKSHEM